jgi:hypothetical protein
MDMGKNSEKTEIKGAKIFEFGEQQELVDLKNEQMNDCR